MPERDHQFRILLSYHYFRDVDMDALFAKLFGEGPMPEVFADSGAYSALTQGAPIDIHHYATWVKRWSHLFHVYSNLDEIGDGEQSAEGTWRNQRILEDEHGLTPLPVFHAGEPWSALDRLLESGYRYVALGGLVGRRKAAVLPWAVKCHRAAQGRAVFHGFGMTTWEPLMAIPWYSVDSSTWGSAFRYGRLKLFDDDLGRFVEVPNNHAGVYGGDGARLIRSYGFTPADFARRDKQNRARICQISALSWQRAESWLRQRHGPVRIPEGGNPDGLRWYCADTDPLNLAYGAAGLRLYLADTDPLDFGRIHDNRVTRGGV